MDAKSCEPTPSTPKRSFSTDSALLASLCCERPSQPQRHKSFLSQHVNCWCDLSPYPKRPLSVRGLPVISSVRSFSPRFRRRRNTSSSLPISASPSSEKRAKSTVATSWPDSVSTLLSYDHQEATRTSL